MWGSAMRCQYREGSAWRCPTMLFMPKLTHYRRARGTARRLESIARIVKLGRVNFNAFKS